MNYTSYHCHYADLHLFPIPPFPTLLPRRAFPVFPSCTCFRRSMKRTMIGLSVLGGAAFLAVALILPPFACFRPGYAGLVAMSTVAGVLRGGLDPLFFETSAEVREGRERRKEERQEEEKRRLNCAVRCRVLVCPCAFPTLYSYRSFFLPLLPLLLAVLRPRRVRGDRRHGADRHVASRHDHVSHGGQRRGGRV